MSKLVGVRIDIETKSGTDIKRGVYKYAEDPEFEVLITAYSPLREVDGRVRLGAPRTLDMYDQADVDKFADILRDDRFQKHAYNAAFERVSLSRWLGMDDGEYIDPHNWHCSAIRANVSGIFGTLDDVARAVRSPIKKDSEGKRLIRLFSIPDKKTHLFHQPVADCWCGADHTRDWAKYHDYCKTDVLTEAAVASQVPDLPAQVQAEYEADQRINDRGVRHFKRLSEQAVDSVTTEQARLMGELKQLTGLDNPNSGKQMNEWLAAQKYPMVSLDKAHRAEALADPFIPEVVAEALTLKGSASLTSASKHKAMLATRCNDGRIRGSLQFYGAHTGREAGRGFQPQNLPRYEAPEADRVRMIYGRAGSDAPMIAKGTARAAIVPSRGNLFVVPDYNAIEARCLGWQAGERWVEDEFKVGQGKIYEATASTMFGVDKTLLVDALKACGKCGVCPNCELRARGKVSNLALGYAGGAGALVTMGAEAAGIDVGNYPDLNAEWKAAGMPGKFHEWESDRHDYPELKRLRDLYRDASPATVRFWKLCAKSWDIAALTGRPMPFGQDNILTMTRDGRHNRLILPSGRSIWYRFARAHVDPDRVGPGGEAKIDRRTFIGKGTGVGHVRTDTHGGKLTENITQAVARDVLFDLIMRLEAKTAKGWPGRVVLHVHDEVVVEAPAKSADQVLADTLGEMADPPAWAQGLALQGAGSIMERYGK